MIQSFLPGCHKSLSPRLAEAREMGMTYWLGQAEAESAGSL
jgi:hypothetical protein